MKKVFTMCIFIVLIIASGLVYFNIQTGPYDSSSEKQVLVDIKKGSSLNSVSEILFEKKLIKNKLFFKITAKVNDMDKGIKAGLYKINQSYSNKEILDILNSGRVYKDLVKVTIPEGFEAHQIAERISKLGLVDKNKFMDLVNNPSVFSENYKFLNEEDILSLEGYLFPDTYFFNKSYSEEDVINVMLKRFDEIYTDEYKKVQDEKNLTLNQVISLASIVEREARLDEERNVIAGVFYNRMDIKMPLQSCATVQYILGERKPNLSFDDIKIDSPYNTYKNAGLPPGPIASPGKKSIEAALYPDDVDYLYFVAKKNGSHSFSKTYNEHLKRKAENESE
ncbi:endolytic transglycosylase MltG [Tepidibacter hydrothermalis]|uniref:Endolytic murein transglycosylase n=1 Tax=Tepidibacter hydrothermalis TaxID=3036126 RepID=A0ABY8EAU3_9FIRM|nr:endolytic transglycosylase MltG [Tepidibacter hydrothermalis]WFD09010.1 endolytic transglycosylase MltG [Tepidibacter hydrothermalis]